MTADYSLKRIAILASGNGTNAENIVHYFEKNFRIAIAGIWTNKKDAYVIERAKKLGLPCKVFTKDNLMNGSLTEDLIENKIDYLVLAGFLLKISPSLLKEFNEKIINIHPSLLPKFGGKGMYGNAVHEAVIAAKEKISGISIHVVTEEYDEGPILFQATVPIDMSDTVEQLANKIHQLEYNHYPRVIEEYIQRRLG